MNIIRSKWRSREILTNNKIGKIIAYVLITGINKFLNNLILINFFNFEDIYIRVVISKSPKENATPETEK